MKKVLFLLIFLLVFSCKQTEFSAGTENRLTASIDMSPETNYNNVDFTSDDAIEIKKIEKSTNHDVKAVEYFIKQKFHKIGISDYKEFIHFGLTSQDINNTATPLLFKDSLNEIFFPSFLDLGL